MRIPQFTKNQRRIRIVVSALAAFSLLAMMTLSTRTTPVVRAIQDQSTEVAQTVFSNPAAIAPADRASNNAGTNPGVPAGGAYPSTITVAGLSGTISKVTVTFAITSTFPDDFDIMLVGPTLARSLVMSDAGGSADHTNITYTFDQAAALMPDNPTAVVPAGTYRPSNYAGLATPEPGGQDNFPTPGPGLMSYPADFNIFNGTNPNGTWSLYVVDDQVIDTMSLPSGWSIDITTAGGYRGVYDFTGDGSTDFTQLVIGAASSPITWKTLRNPANPNPNQAFIRQFDFGLVGDSVTAGDYSGDAKTEVSVWRTGTFYHVPFPEGPGPLGTVSVVPWGAGGDNLGRVGDYDGDGKDDETVIRIVSNVLNWHIRGSGGTNRVTPFGMVAAGVSTLAFQGADFTGDGREELVLCQITNASGSGQWLIGDSITGSVILTVNFGNFNTDFFINPDDYNGDGKADIVIWRAGGAGADARAWYIRDTMTGNTLPVVVFGIGDPNFVNNDIPLRGNYDGDSKADIAVYRRSTREWFWIKSSDGTLGYQQWGVTGDVPLPNFFVF